MLKEDFMALLGTDAARAEEFLLNPDCPTEFKQAYFDEDCAAFEEKNYPQMEALA